MNEPNNPKNIFEAAGQSRKIIKPDSDRKKTEERSSEFSSTIKIPPSEMLDLNVDPEINLILNQMLKIKDEFEDKLNKIYEDNGLSQSQIDNYLNNPNNFSPENWTKIQLQRESLENQINIVLNKKRKKTSIIPVLQNQQSKDRKSKTLGSRKNWIPM